MHACDLGVESVKTEVGSNEVRVKGVVEAEKLVSELYKKTGKQASVLNSKEEEKKEDNEEKKKKEEEEDDKKTETIEIKKTELMPPKCYLDYAYPPQIFSDDNPHACTLM